LEDGSEGFTLDTGIAHPRIAAADQDGKAIGSSWEATRHPFFRLDKGLIGSYGQNFSHGPENTGQESTKSREGARQPLPGASFRRVAVCLCGLRRAETYKMQPLIGQEFTGFYANPLMQNVWHASCSSRDSPCRAALAGLGSEGEPCPC
jgi:hypothetical protein